MQRIFLCSLVFLAFAFAQSPQTGNLTNTATELVSGVVTSGILLPTTTASNYHVQLYKLWVPQNTSTITLTFSNTASTDCSYIHMFVRSDGLPCSYHDYATGEYACANSFDPGNGISGTNTQTIYPGYSSDLFEFQVNKYTYIAFGRYGSYNTDTCTYSVNATVTQGCPAGQAAAYVSSTTYQCQTVVAATSGVMVNQVNSTLFLAMIPDGTPSVNVMVNTTSNDVEIYGLSYAATTGSNYNCYTSSASSSGTFYIYNLVCYTPRMGEFYINIFDDEGDAFTAMTMITINSCAAGMGGFNCTYPSVPLNTTALASGVTLTIPYDANALNYAFSYMYLDTSASMTDSIQVTATATTGSGYMYYRRGGFNEDSSTYGYEDSFEYDSYPASYTVNNFEYAVGGRIYFGFQCTTSTTGCTILVSANSTSSSSGVVTTGMQVTTGVQVTTAAAVTTGPPTPTTGIQVTTGLRVTTGLQVTTQQTVTTGSADDSSAFAMLPMIALMIVAMLI